MSSSTEECPVCGKQLFSAKVEEHVNICLDGGDASEIGVAAPQNGSSDPDSMDIDIVIEDDDLEMIKRLQSQEDRATEMRRKQAEENERYIFSLLQHYPRILRIHLVLNWLQRIQVASHNSI